MNADELKKMISEKIPEGLVVPRHDERGHWYHVPSLGKTFPSMTGKLQILKDPSLKNYAVNENNKYIFEHFPEITEANLMDHLDKAKSAAEVKRDTAGDFGTEMHDIRQRYFQDWISEGKRPTKTLFEYIPEVMSNDPRAISCVRALDRFLLETLYVPIGCEILLYSDRYEVGGTLDDVGLMHRVLRRGYSNCNHDYIFGTRNINCYLCPHKLSANPKFILLDLKTSNQFKDHYWLQVLGYYMMFSTLTGIHPKELFILKLSKDDGTYKLEKIKRHIVLTKYVTSFFRTCVGLDVIKSLRFNQGKKMGRPLIFKKDTV